MNPQPAAETLAPTQQVDSDHPAIVKFAQSHAEGKSDRERAVSLYYAVRDRVRYDPYRVNLSPLGAPAALKCTRRIRIILNQPLGRQ